MELRAFLFLHFTMMYCYGQQVEIVVPTPPKLSIHQLITRARTFPRTFSQTRSPPRTVSVRTVTRRLSTTLKPLISSILTQRLHPLFASIIPSRRPYTRQPTTRIRSYTPLRLSALLVKKVTTAAPPLLAEEPIDILNSITPAPPACLEKPLHPVYPIHPVHPPIQVVTGPTPLPIKLGPDPCVPNQPVTLAPEPKPPTMLPHSCGSCDCCCSQPGEPGCNTCCCQPNKNVQNCSPSMNCPLTCDNGQQNDKPCCNGQQLPNCPNGCMSCVNTLKNCKTGNCPPDPCSRCKCEQSPEEQGENTLKVLDDLTHNNKVPIVHSSKHLIIPIKPHPIFRNV